MNAISQADHSLFLEGPVGSGKTTAALEHFESRIHNGLSPLKILILLPTSPPAPSRFSVWQRRGAHILTYDLFIRATLKRLLPVRHDVGATDRLIDHNLNRYLLEQFIDSRRESELFTQSRLNRATIIRRLCRLEYQLAVNGNIAANATNAVIREMFAFRRNDLFAEIFAFLDVYHAHLTEKQILNPAQQVAAFEQRILDNAGFRSYMQSNYDVLLVDNVEGLSKSAHDLIFWCLEHLSLSVIIYDDDGDCNDIWGANPANAMLLRDVCQQNMTFNAEQRVIKRIALLQAALSIDNSPALYTHDQSQQRSHDSMFHIVESHFSSAIARQCVDIIQNIGNQYRVAILSPLTSPLYVHDIANLLSRAGIPFVRLETHCSVTESLFSAALSTFLSLTATSPKNIALQEIAAALRVFITGLDPLRARLLALNLHNLGDAMPVDTGRIQARFDEKVIKAYTYLIEYMRAFQKAPRLSEYLNYFIEFVLTQPGFALFNDPHLQGHARTLLEYVHQIEAQASSIHAAVPAVVAFLSSNGVIQARDDHPASGIMIGSVQQFLRLGQTVDYQIWLDAHHRAWQCQAEQVLFSVQFIHTASGAQERQQPDQLQETFFYKRVSALVRRCRRQVVAVACRADYAGITDAQSLVQLIQKL